jgi:CRISPR-associated protein Cas5d
MSRNTHTLEVWGDFACFTRPEMKVERFSYPVITPSAARGIFDAIYWDGIREKKGKENIMRPYFYWQVTQIEILETPRYIALRRNEVKDKVPGTATLNKWMEGKEVPEPIWADGGKDELGTDQKGRTQRQTMALKNVRYLITAQIIPKSNFVNDLGKFNGQFERRAKQGKCFQQPYLGCREFPAFFEYVESPANEKKSPINMTRNLGLMLYDVFDLRKNEMGANDKPFITLFEANMRNGIIDVPSFAQPEILKPGE